MLDVLEAVPLFLHSLVTSTTAGPGADAPAGHASPASTSSNGNGNGNGVHSNGNGNGSSSTMPAAPAPAAAHPTLPARQYLAHPPAEPAHAAAEGGAPVAQLEAALRRATGALPSAAARDLWRRVHWNAFDLVAWRLRQRAAAVGAAAHDRHIPTLTWQADGTLVDATAEDDDNAAAPRRHPLATPRQTPYPQRPVEDVLTCADFRAITAAVQGLGEAEAARRRQQEQRDRLERAAAQAFAAADVQAAQRLLLAAALHNRACQAAMRHSDAHVCSQAWIRAVTTAAAAEHHAPPPPPSATDGAATAAAPPAPVKRSRGRPRKQSPSPPPPDVPASPSVASASAGVCGGHTGLVLDLLACARELQGCLEVPLPEHVLARVDGALAARWQEALALWSAHHHGDLQQQQQVEQQEQQRRRRWQRRLGAPEEPEEPRLRCHMPLALGASPAASAASSAAAAADEWLWVVWQWAPPSAPPQAAAEGGAEEGAAAGALSPQAGLRAALSLFQARLGLGGGRPPAPAIRNELLRTVVGAADAAVVRSAQAAGLRWAGGAVEKEEQQQAPELVEVLRALLCLVEAHVGWRQQAEEGHDGDAEHVVEVLWTKVEVTLAMLPDRAWASQEFLSDTWPGVAQAAAASAAAAQHPGGAEALLQRLSAERWADLAAQLLQSAAAPPGGSSAAAVEGGEAWRGGWAAGGPPRVLPADALLRVVRAARAAPRHALPGGGAWARAVDGALAAVVEAAAVTQFARLDVWAELLREVGEAGWACPRAAAALCALLDRAPHVLGPGLEEHEVRERVLPQLLEGT